MGSFEQPHMSSPEPPPDPAVAFERIKEGDLIVNETDSLRAEAILRDAGFGYELKPYVLEETLPDSLGILPGSHILRIHGADPAQALQILLEAQLRVDLIKAPRDGHRLRKEAA